MHAEIKTQEVTEMRETYILAQWSVHAVTILFFASTLSGCGPLLTFYANLTTGCPKSQSASEKCRLPPHDEFSQQLAKKLGVMALFAYVVYRTGPVQKDPQGAGCGYLTSGIDDDYGMPRSDAGQWQRWRPKDVTPSSADPVSPCLDQDGLFYETYVYRLPDGTPTEAVIAFRGTENSPLSEAVKDWQANIWAALGMEPGQYRLAREQIPKVIERLRQENPDIAIYATGHSLGGGLAQQAGYLSRHIKEVFTFNTSPVTNWTWLKIHDAIDKEYPAIYRIFHSGEILEKVRFVTTNFTSASYGRYDIGVQYEPRSNVGGHAMTILACKFVSVIASFKADPALAAHPFPPKFAEELLEKGKMCAGAVKNGGEGNGDVIGPHE